MPNAIVRKWAKQRGMSYDKAHSLWSKAKHAGMKNGQPDWQITMAVFKKMMHRESLLTSSSSSLIESHLNNTIVLAE